MPSARQRERAPRIESQDHLVEITLTIAAYGSFMLAEQMQTSGVLGSLTAGLVIGNIGWTGMISEGGRKHILRSGPAPAFLANSIFILLGSQEAHQPIVGFIGWRFSR